MSVSEIIDGVIAREGGYVFHAADRGGPTRFGVTQAVARANGYRGEMRELPLALARSIYLTRYFVEPGFDRVQALSARLAEELTDTGINMGVATAVSFLQRALNALNQSGRLYADVKVDGQCGPGTQAALSAFLRERGTEGEVVLLRALNCLQGERYIALAESRAANEAFVYGWLRERVA